MSLGSELNTLEMTFQMILKEMDLEAMEMTVKRQEKGTRPSHSYWMTIEELEGRLKRLRMNLDQAIRRLQSRSKIFRPQSALAGHNERYRSQVALVSIHRRYPQIDARAWEVSEVIAKLVGVDIEVPEGVPERQAMCLVQRILDFMKECPELADESQDARFGSLALPQWPRGTEGIPLTTWVMVVGMLVEVLREKFGTHTNEPTPKYVKYIVKSGDWLSKIAERYGVDWRKDIYDHPKNAEFKKLRPDPNLIYPNDVIYIPVKG